VTLEDINFELLSCRQCTRLVTWREQVAREKRHAYRNWNYWGKPVPGFGASNAKIFVIGLAPGAHGANRTGRQFTGDASGDFLFPALYRAGFSSQPHSFSRDDGLILTHLYIAPICRCVPPANKPTAEEISNCQPYLERELEVIKPKVFVALGAIAFSAIFRILIADNKRLENFLDRSLIRFSHNATFQLDNDHWLLASYHPSRQNTQTGRLTKEMFDDIWMKARELMER
jgi:uracil-DNA glycosylase family 4